MQPISSLSTSLSSVSPRSARGVSPTAQRARIVSPPAQGVYDPVSMLTHLHLDRVPSVASGASMGTRDSRVAGEAPETGLTPLTLFKQIMSAVAPPSRVAALYQEWQRYEPGSQLSPDTSCQDIIHRMISAYHDAATSAEGANNHSLPPLNLTSLNLTNVCFSDRHANLTNIDFSGSTLDGTTFTDADLTGTNFTNSSLVNATFTDADLTRTNFTKANLTSANFQYASGNNVTFTGVTMGDADLSHVKGSKWCFDQAIVHNTNMNESELKGLTCRNAFFTGVEAAQSTWQVSDCTGLRATDCYLLFSRVSITNATGSEWSKCRLNLQPLTGSLSGSTIKDTHFNGTVFEGRWLSPNKLLSVLSNTTLIRCTFDIATLTGGIDGSTVLIACDLSNAFHIDTIPIPNQCQMVKVRLSQLVTRPVRTWEPGSLLFCPEPTPGVTSGLDNPGGHDWSGQYATVDAMTQWVAAAPQGPWPTHQVLVTPSEWGDDDKINRVIGIPNVVCHFDRDVIMNLPFEKWSDFMTLPNMFNLVLHQYASLTPCLQEQIQHQNPLWPIWGAISSVPEENHAAIDGTSPRARIQFNSALLAVKSDGAIGLPVGYWHEEGHPSTNLAHLASWERWEIYKNQFPSHEWTLSPSLTLLMAIINRCHGKPLATVTEWMTRLRAIDTTVMGFPIDLKESLELISVVPLKAQRE